jgi:hypothetical protein
MVLRNGDEDRKSMNDIWHCVEASRKLAAARLVLLGLYIHEDY